MAFSPIAFIAPNYRDFKNYWLKAYEPGTTTPKSMATDSTLSVFIAKAELNKDGFIESAGGALLIPYIENTYDLWLFPTEAEADANDTVNAERLADNITGVNGATTNSFNVKSFATLSLAVNSTNILLIADGATLNIKERTTGNGGGSIWDVVLASSVTTNAIDIVQCVGVPTLALVLRGAYTSSSLGLTSTPAVTDLRQLTPKDGYAASIVIDGFSYDYVFDSSSTQTDNGITCLTSLSTGRWQQTSTMLFGSFALSVPVDFTTLKEAMEYCSQYSPKDSTITCTTTLQAGFVMAEQVIVSSVDLSWVIIESVDPVVSATRSAMTTALYNQFPLFGADKSGRTPTINCKFAIDATGTATNRSFVYCDHGGGAVVMPSAGCTGAFDGLFALSAGSHISAPNSIVEESLQNNVFAINGATIDVFGGNFSNSIQYNIYASRASIINCRECTAIDAGSDNVRAAHGSSIAASQATLTGAGEHGVYAFDTSNISAEFSDTSGANNSGFFAVHSSKISALGGVADGCGENGVYALKSSEIAADDLHATGCDIGAKCEDGSSVTISGPTVDLSGSLSTAAFAEDNSEINAFQGNLSGALNRGVQANHNSIVTCRECDVSGATDRAISAFGVSTINAESANLSGAGVNGCRADRGSTVDVTSANCQVGGGPSAADIVCSTGSTVIAHGATGGVSKTANVLNTDGVIFN